MSKLKIRQTAGGVVTLELDGAPVGFLVEKVELVLDAQTAGLVPRVRLTIPVTDLDVECDEAVIVVDRAD